MGKYVIDMQHREFFSQEGYLELEHLIHEKEVKKLRESLHLHMLPLNSLPSNKVMASSRNFWRQEPLVKKLILSSDLTEIALDLTRKPMLKLGVDQLLTPKIISYMPSTESIAIEDLFSIQDQMIGLLINLSLHLEVMQDPSLACYPKEPGSGVFFKPRYKIDLNSFARETDSLFLLVTYASTKARYKLNEKDPCTHDVKREGKAFGDILAESYHPLITKASLK